MPRKGTATVKKHSKYSKYLSLGEEEETSPVIGSSDKSGVRYHSGPVLLSRPSGTFGNENVNPAIAREQPKLSTEAHRKPALGYGANHGQPRQDSGTVPVEQSAALAESLFPDEDGFSATNAHDIRHPTPANTRTAQKGDPVLKARPRVRKSATQRSRVANSAKRTANSKVNNSPQRRQPRPERLIQNEAPVHRDPATMIQGGASIPPNQQRNMRACMVCSIVRTQQQFTTQGCPNCEDILELAGNPEQVNDCTSQVFEGLISVADTNRSWVARYQRLEGYVPGVYATQVEGILPEDILVAVENAGINYVPRDGSEQEMLGAD
jgi:transcription elongation factor SPT4